MNLKRTTIIPIDDQKLATSIFKSFIDMEMMILMIILGDTDTIREALPKADNLATLEDFGMKRWVLWIRDYATLEKELKKYIKADNADNPDEEYENIKCFCFSPISDEVSGIILKNGTLSYLSLNYSFLKAHQHDRSATDS